VSLLVVLAIVWVSTLVVSAVMLHRAHTRGEWLTADRDRHIELAAGIASENVSLLLKRAGRPLYLPDPDPSPAKPWWVKEMGKQSRTNVPWRGEA
jgi:Na+-transporting NADH:ubiquinone oxidoreductase subunit NqrC